MSKSYIESSLADAKALSSRQHVCQEDTTFEIPLRPQTLTEFSGQEAIKERLDVLIGAAKMRKEPLGHCLFCGPPGLGKTTLANILAKSMGTNLVVTSGAVLEKAGDLAGILTNLKTGDVLFIDELHRLNATVEEYLYPAMEDFKLDLMIDTGPNARTVQVNLNRFTLAGATTRMGLLSAPLRSRFAFTSRLDYYDVVTLERIIERNSRILNAMIDMEGIREIAKRARGTPRISNNLLRWVRDYAQMRAGSKTDRHVVIKALEMLNIDEMGLDEMDKKILEVLIDFYDGGPAGLNTIAVAIGEEGETIEEVYEPYLIMKGFIKRTPRGRVATPLAYELLGRNRLK